MSTLIIDKKEYVVVPKKEYESLLAKAASKTKPARKLNLKEGKRLAYQLIDTWAKEK
jgi:hypothetical protein